MLIEVGDNLASCILGLGVLYGFYRIIKFIGTGA